MIKSFRRRAVSLFWHKGDASKIRPDHVDRLQERLDILNRAAKLSDLHVPGFDFHRLSGKPVRYSLHISGPWCVTFTWDGEDAVQVDYEQYH
jgi:toxin HigB-1